jgi:hypothetical protein
MKLGIKGRWHRLYQWEYWPFELVYLPVFAYWLYLAIKARSLFFFSAANPNIPTGGILGESKWDILKHIHPENRPQTYWFADATAEPILKTIGQHGLHYPLIVKPDIGERGRGVRLCHDEIELKAALAKIPIAVLLQSYCALPEEYAVFYYRLPNKARGHISSVTAKDFLHVIGDGHQTISELMLASPRAQLQWKRFKQERDLNFIPEKGEKIVLEPIGNHCRGTTFLDGNALIDEAMEHSFDTIAAQLPDFHYGRFDLKCASVDALKKGEVIIVEVNGVGAEPAHIYQPGYPLFKAWKELLQHWHVLYSISVFNHRQYNVPFMTLKEARVAWKKVQLINKSFMQYD